jgi:hypothetical protein
LLLFIAVNLGLPQSLDEKSLLHTVIVLHPLCYSDH